MTATTVGPGRSARKPDTQVDPRPLARALALAIRNAHRLRVEREAARTLRMVERPSDGRAA